MKSIYLLTTLLITFNLDSDISIPFKFITPPLYLSSPQDSYVALLLYNSKKINFHL